MMDLWDKLLGRPIELLIMEDNQATIKVARKGYSARLRHVPRTHKVDLGSIREVLDGDNVKVEYCHTEYQAADIFTKALPPLKWDNAVALLGMETHGTYVSCTPARLAQPPGVGACAPPDPLPPLLVPGVRASPATPSSSSSAPAPHDPRKDIPVEE